MKWSSPRFLPVVGVCLLVATLCAELALSARRLSQTPDEAAHILAGYRSWVNFDFGINPEHPPLVKLVATLPLLRFPLQVPPLPRGYFRGVEFLGGEKFLYSNDVDAILFRTRLAAATFTVGLALAVFFSTLRVWGMGPAFLALILLVFEPNLLAHGALVTTDVGVTVGFFLAVVAYSAYLKKPSAGKLALAGIAASIAVVTKHSGILVFPMLALLALIDWWWGLRSTPTQTNQSSGPAERAWRLLYSLAAIGATAFVLLWACYGFRYAARPSGLGIDPPLPAFATAGTIGSQIVLGAARWKLLPESYLFGLADVFTLPDKTPAFLFGTFYSRGQWFYFPTVFIIKSTVGFLLLLLALPLAKKAVWGDHWRDTLFFLAPGALYFIVAVASGVNLGERHILPVYPFWIVLAAAGAWSLAQRSRAYLVVVGCLVVFHVVSSVRAFPNYLPYSNEFWGGPTKTYRVLNDSNVDWSQGLKAMRQYLDKNHIKDCWFATFGPAAPYYGIRCRPLPTSFERLARVPMTVIPSTIDGPLFLGASEISGPLWGSDQTNPYVQFRQKVPAAVIAGSILMFDGRNDLSAAAALSHASASANLLENGNPVRALAEADVAVSLSPDSADAHFARGSALAKMKRDSDAFHEFEVAQDCALGRRLAP